MSQQSNVLAGALFAPTYILGPGRPPPADPAGDAIAADSAREAAAYQRGRQDGLAAGRAQGHAQGLRKGRADERAVADAELAEARHALEDVRRSFEQALQALGGERNRLLDQARDDLLALALAIARKIVHTEVAASRDIAAHVARDALDAARDATVLHVRLNPRDRELLAADPCGLEAIALVADPAISPGGCIVETQCGAIDATVETQWQQVTAALLNAAGRPDGAQETSVHPAPLVAAPFQSTPDPATAGD